MFTKLICKFLILIYLFSVSSYSQQYEQQGIEQRETENEDHLVGEIVEESGEADKTPVTVESCGRNNIDDKYDEKIVYGRSMK
jgi:hypothetical protein